MAYEQTLPHVANLGDGDDFFPFLGPGSREFTGKTSVPFLTCVVRRLLSGFVLTRASSAGRSFPPSSRFFHTNLGPLLSRDLSTSRLWVLQMITRDDPRFFGQNVKKTIPHVSPTLFRPGGVPKMFLCVWVLLTWSFQTGKAPASYLGTNINWNGDGKHSPFFENPGFHSLFLFLSVNPKCEIFHPVGT